MTHQSDRQTTNPVKELINYYKQDDPFAKWNPDWLIELFASAEYHYHQQTGKVNRDGIAEYRVRNVPGWEEMIKNYFPPLGILHRLGKRRMAAELGYKRAQKIGFNADTAGEQRELELRLRRTLNWTLSKQDTDRFNTEMNAQRRRQQEHTRKLQEQHKVFTQQDAKRRLMYNALQHEIDQTGGETYGWDLAHVASTFYKPMERGKLGAEAAPAVLQLARILQDAAISCGFQDNSLDIIKLAIVLVGEGPQLYLQKLENALHGGDMFNAQVARQTVARIRNAGIITQDDKQDNQ